LQCATIYLKNAILLSIFFEIQFVENFFNHLIQQLLMQFLLRRNY